MSTLGPVENLGEMLDTPPAQRERYYAMLRAMTPQQKAEKVVSLSRMTRELALAGLRREDPQASEEQLGRRLAERMYGRDVVARLLDR